MIDTEAKMAEDRMIEATWSPYRPFLAMLAAVQEQNMKLTRYSTGCTLEVRRGSGRPCRRYIEGRSQFIRVFSTPLSPPQVTVGPVPEMGTQTCR